MAHTQNVNSIQDLILHHSYGDASFEHPEIAPLCSQLVDAVELPRHFATSRSELRPTQFILLSGSACVYSGVLRFFSQAGQALARPLR